MSFTNILSGLYTFFSGFSSSELGFSELRYGYANFPSPNPLKVLTVTMNIRDMYISGFEDSDTDKINIEFNIYSPSKLGKDCTFTAAENIINALKNHRIESYNIKEFNISKTTYHHEADAFLTTLTVNFVNPNSGSNAGVLISIPGKSAVKAYSFQIKTIRAAYDIQAFGESGPVGFVMQNNQYEITFDVKSMDFTYDFTSITDFDLTVDFKGNQITFSGCNTIDINSRLTDEITDTVTILAKTKTLGGA
ncbi:MAG: hypothetical protein Q8876_00155 [Bacillota bacterium]|nr:hypothetical protein [Bacillota bacterium]